MWRFVYAEQAAPPYPSFADVLWLTTYPLFYVGVMLLIRARVAAFQSGAWLDGLIACSAVAAVAVTFYFVPVLERTEGDAAAIAVTMAYPIGDGLLWVLLLAALALSGWRMTRPSPCSPRARSPSPSATPCWRSRPPTALTSRAAGPT